MPLSVQGATPASQGAQMLTGAPSSSPASSTGEGDSGEQGFSRHLDAEKHREPERAYDTRKDAANKPAESTAKTAKAGAVAEEPESVEGRDKVAVDAVENNKVERTDTEKVASQGQAKQDALADNQGLKNAPASGLSTLAIEAPLMTMGERVRSLLAAETNVEGIDSQVSGAEETLEASLVTVASGNEPPLEDAPLPQQTTALEANESTAVTLVPLDETATDLELLPLQEELVATTTQQMTTQVSSESVAGVLRQGEALNSDDLELQSSMALKKGQAVDVLTRPNPALTAVNPELARTLSGKQASVSAELVTEELSVDIDIDAHLGSSREPILAKAIKPLFEGGVSNGALKQPAAPAVAEALVNVPAPKDNFEQVRQNIMAVMAGKPEIAGPALVLSGGVEGAEPLTQGLNFSSVSATLTATGSESAKYAATQEAAPARFFTLQTPAGQPGWDVEVGNRIRWMVGQNNSGVELRLNPPELGSIEVKVATEGERTSVTFFAANPAARDALELALPRLREMFADSGMQLANADVSDQGLGQGREQLSDPEGFSTGGERGDGMILEAGPGLIPGGAAESRGVIDYYI